MLRQSAQVHAVGDVDGRGVQLTRQVRQRTAIRQPQATAHSHGTRRIPAAQPLASGFGRPCRTWHPPTEHTPPSSRSIRNDAESSILDWIELALPPDAILAAFKLNRTVFLMNDIGALTYNVDEEL